MIPCQVTWPNKGNPRCTTNFVVELLVLSRYPTDIIPDFCTRINSLTRCHRIKTAAPFRDLSGVRSHWLRVSIDSDISSFICPPSSVAAPGTAACILVRDILLLPTIITAWQSGKPKMQDSEQISSQSWITQLSSSQQQHPSNLVTQESSKTKRKCWCWEPEASPTGARNFHINTVTLRIASADG